MATPEVPTSGPRKGAVSFDALVHPGPGLVWLPALVAGVGPVAPGPGSSGAARDPDPDRTARAGARPARVRVGFLRRAGVAGP